MLLALNSALAVAGMLDFVKMLSNIPCDPFHTIFYISGCLAQRFVRRP